jgi:hypothetical protein
MLDTGYLSLDIKGRKQKSGIRSQKSVVQAYPAPIHRSANGKGRFGTYPCPTADFHEKILYQMGV